MNTSNLTTRALTSAVYVAVLLGCTLQGYMWSAVLFGLFTAFASWELATLVNSTGYAHVSRVLATLAATGFYVSRLELLPHNLSFLAYVPFVILIMVSELFGGTVRTPLKSMALSLFPALYAALPFSMVPALGVTADGGYSFVVPLLLFLFVWINDTGAYLSGSTLGKHKMCVSISPKKTWEGFAGGAALTVLTAVILCLSIPKWFAGRSLAVWVGMAAVVVVSGTLGDLVESLFKRELGVKDSGNILPGHGGLLDRLDSTLLAAPATMLYLSLFQAVC